MIDRELGLVFRSEEELYEHFQPYIEKAEKDHQKYLSQGPWSELALEDLEDQLDQTLDEPAEIWYDDKTFSDIPIFHFIRPLDELDAFHVVVTFVSSDDEPTFIFLHFVTTELALVDKYRRGDLVYDQSFEEVGFAMLEGDSLSEGDPLSMGLFISMLKVRSETDIPYDQFLVLGQECREPTIEEADEIWRTQDSHGNNIVTFIKEFSDHATKDLHYIAITQEDESSAVHTLLFSFPTQDSQLVDRYRHGENLQAEEVQQESSH